MIITVDELQTESVLQLTGAHQGGVAGSNLGSNHLPGQGSLLLCHKGVSDDSGHLRQSGQHLQLLVLCGAASHVPRTLGCLSCAHLREKHTF